SSGMALLSQAVSQADMVQAPSIPCGTGPDLRAACRNRTDDLFITSEPLWPTELTRRPAQCSGGVASLVWCGVVSGVSGRGGCCGAAVGGGWGGVWAGGGLVLGVGSRCGGGDRRACGA